MEYHWTKQEEKMKAADNQRLSQKAIVAPRGIERLRVLAAKIVHFIDAAKFSGIILSCDAKSRLR